MLTYRLVYFNLRGRAEFIRLLFAYKNVKYEDFRIRSKDWPTFKPQIPTGKLPMLEVIDGENVTQILQSKAICRYLAYKFDLAGKTDLERAKVDEVVDQITDEVDALSRFNLERDETIKYKYLDEYMNVLLPRFSDYHENVLKQNGTGFVVGDSLTWADFALMNKWEWLDSDSREGIFETHPLIKAHYEKIRQIPQIDEWIRKRPISKI